MTMTNTMEPRALDRAIAERLGWTFAYIRTHVNVRYYRVYDSQGEPVLRLTAYNNNNEYPEYETELAYPSFSSDLNEAMTLLTLPGERIEIARYPDGTSNVQVFGLRGVYNENATTPAQIAYHVALGWLRVSAWQRGGGDDAAAG